MGEADAFGHRKKMSVVEKPKTRRMSHYPWTKVGRQVAATGVNTPKRMSPNLGGVRFNFLEADLNEAAGTADASRVQCSRQFGPR